MHLRAWLDGLMPRSAWRIVLAFVSGFITFSASTGGLFIVLPWAQSAIIGGIAVGLVAPKLRSAAVIGAAVGLMAELLGPGHVYSSYLASQPLTSQGAAIAGAAVACAAVAASVSLMRRRWARAGFVLTAVALALLIGNLWFTALTVNKLPGMAFGATGQPYPSFNAQLEGDWPAESLDSDAKLFFDVYEGMEGGADYYSEYARVLTKQRGGVTTPADFRTPTLFWLWSALPNSRFIVIAFLALASVAIVSTVPIALAAVKAPFLLPGAAALTSLLLYVSVNIALLKQDPWAGVIGVLALSALAASLRSPKWRLWTVLGVALAVLAVLTREVMGFFLLAGFASAFLGDRQQRRFRVVGWSAGLFAFVLLYGAHVLATQPFLTPQAGIPRAGLGSLSFMLAALNWGTDMLGRGGWLPMVLGAMGIAGAATLRDIRLRAVALGFILVTLASCLLIGNTAHMHGPNGQIIYFNYWGACLEPIVYALAPTALVMIPGAEASRRSPEDGV